MSGIAYRKDSPRPRYRQVGPDNDLSELICFCVEPAPRRRRNYTSSPEYSASQRSVFADYDSFRIYVRNPSVGIDLDAQALQVPLRFDRKTFRIRGQNTRRH